MEKQNKNKTAKKYFWEILCIILGTIIFKFGIDDGFKGSIGYNSKGIMGVHNGFMEAFYGLLLIIGGFGSIYSKKMK
ncbi:hypothetical protein RCH33_2333 [Flavobacterium daejeonense]|nr:hypothetical protein RCH33_2333 [Flavobacterium daejeonense]